MAIAIPTGNTSAINAALSQAVVGPLQEKSTFLSLPGINIVDTAAPLRIPLSATTAPAAAFTAPGDEIAQQNVGLTEKVLLPTERVGIKSLTAVSNELIRMAQLNLESVLQQRIVEDAAVVLDAALWNGAGTADSITGVLHGVTATSSADLLTDPDVLIDALAEMAESYVTPPTVLVMRPTTYAALRKIKVSSTDNRYVIDPPAAAFAVGQQNLFGVAVVTTTAVPANSVAILDTSHIWVGRDIDSSVVVLTEHLAPRTASASAPSPATTC